MWGLCQPVFRLVSLYLRGLIVGHNWCEGGFVPSSQSRQSEQDGPAAAAPSKFWHKDWNQSFLLVRWDMNRELRTKQVSYLHTWDMNWDIIWYNMIWYLQTTTTSLCHILWSCCHPTCYCSIATFHFWDIYEKNFFLDKVSWKSVLQSKFSEIWTFGRQNLSNEASSV